MFLRYLVTVIATFDVAVFVTCDVRCLCRVPFALLRLVQAICVLYCFLLCRHVTFQ